MEALLKSPNGVLATRKYLIGATVVAKQVVCYAQAAGNGVLGAPASVNDYTEAVGITQEAGTYSTTQGSGGVVVECSYDPMQVMKGKVSGGTAADTAQVDGTDGTLLTNSTASAGGVLISDADVGTSEYVGGYVVGLTGANAGHVRVIDAHSDNTSTTVDDPFDNALAVNDTFLRTFAPFIQGMELTTNFVQFNGRTGAGVDLPDTGHGVCLGVYIDGQTAIVQGLDIRNATNPLIEVEFMFIDHVANSVA